MNRRQAMKIMAAGAVLPLSPQLAFAENATPCIHDITCQRRDEPMVLDHQALTDFYRRSTLTGFGMANHTEWEAFATFFGADNIAAMKAAGVKKALLELPPLLQPLVDSISSGQQPILMYAANQLQNPWIKDPAVRLSVGRIMAVGIFTMAQNGIRVCCSAVDAADPEDVAKWADYMRGRAPEDTAANARYLAALNDDRLRARLMAHQMVDLGPNDRVVVFHGAYHFEDHQYSLGSILRRVDPSFAVMNAYASLKSYADPAVPEFKAADLVCCSNQQTDGRGRIYPAGHKTLRAARSIAGVDGPASPQLS